jgi:hypothetical protein
MVLNIYIWPAHIIVGPVNKNGGSVGINSSTQPELVTL